MASLSSNEYHMGILGVKTPLDCSCQELLTSPNVITYGWLRKKSLRNKVLAMNWPQVYVVVANRCLYYYSNELSKKSSGSVSLYGFNKIYRVDKEKAREVAWAFKLEHIQPKIPSLYFSASSEKEMVTWMRALKQEMLIANGKSSTGEDSQYGGSLTSEDSWGSSEYKSLESSIYEEPVCRRESTIFPMDKEDSDFEDGEGCSAAPLKPPLGVKVMPSAPILDSSWKEKEPLPQQASDEDYWNMVQFDGSRTDALNIINGIGEKGVYLLRKSDDGSDVLVVNAGTAKKYKVMRRENGRLTLSDEEPDFEKVEELLYHYYSNNLPNSEQRLICPVKFHSNYHDYVALSK